MSDDPLDDLDVDVEGDLARAEQVLTVGVETRTYGKAVTVVEGFDPEAVDVAEVASDLKSRLAVGGTVDDGTIELQGDQRDRAIAALREMGFTVAD